MECKFQFAVPPLQSEVAAAALLEDLRRSYIDERFDHQQAVTEGHQDEARYLHDRQQAGPENMQERKVSWQAYQAQLAHWSRSRTTGKRGCSRSHVRRITRRQV